MPINSFLYPAKNVPVAYEVANSLRMNAADDSYLSRTKGTSDSTTKGTYSVWFKLSTAAGGVTFFDSGTGTADRVVVYISSNETLKLHGKIGNSTVLSMESDAEYRDVSAWSHLVIAIDTAQASSSNRVKVYMNGTQITSWSTETYPSQNDALRLFTSSEVEYIGRNQIDGESTHNGYLAEVVKIDNQQLAPTSFGEFDSDSPTIWKPKDVSGLTFGTNGFYLDFEDSSNLGNDANGGTDFGETNIAATDSATDTPTNNGNTLNPLATTTTQGTVSEGNLEFDRSGSSDSFVSILSTIGASSGKYYAEVKIIDVGSPTQGCVLGFLNLDETNIMSSSSTYLGAATADAGMGWYSVGNVFRQAGHVNIINSYTDNDIVMLAMDLDNGYCYFGKNGSWENSGDPTSTSSGTGGYATSNMTANGTYCFAFSLREAGNIQANFGSPPFSISSGNADANGYGNFEYAPPSGYYALCTKNLSEFG